MERIAVVGLGNLGFWTSVSLGLWLRQAGRAAAGFEVALIDFDPVDGRAVRKGYPPDLLGRLKPEAALAAIARWFGDPVAARFRPVAAAAQSVPGLLRASAVFSAVDSFGDAAFVSLQAAASWQCRLTTGVGERAPHVLEVMPPDTVTLADLYDAAAWRMASLRESCLAGVPLDVHAGAAHPLGVLGGALAVEAYLGRAADLVPYRLALSGSRVLRAEVELAPRPAPAERLLDLAYDAPLGAVFAGAAAALGVGPAETLLVWDLPVVVRSCGCGLSLGFERYPLRAICPRCAAPPVLRRSRRELSLAEAADFVAAPLCSLAAPAGIGLRAETAAGTAVRFRLPFRYEDVPPLAHAAGEPGEGRRSA